MEFEIDITSDKKFEALMPLFEKAKKQRSIDLSAIEEIMEEIDMDASDRETFFAALEAEKIDVIAPNQKMVDALSRLEMPAGVFIDIKMKNK